MRSDERGEWRDIQQDNSTIVGGSGGVSNSAIYRSDGCPDGVSEAGVAGGGGGSGRCRRDVPDAMFAANGANYVYYPICAVRETARFRRRTDRVICKAWAGRRRRRRRWRDQAWWTR